MNSQRNWMTLQYDEIAELINLIGECTFNDDTNKMYESRVNCLPNNFVHGATHSYQTFQPLQPLQPSTLINSNVLRDINNTIDGTGAKSKNRMIKRNSEFSQNLFSNKEPRSSSGSVNVKPLIFPTELQNRTDSQSIQRNLSMFTNHEGIIQVSLRNGIRVDISVDNSVRLTSCSGQIVISLSKTGESSALKHPSGCVQQFGKNVQIIANGKYKNDNATRYASMSSNGISFASSKLVEIFLLDTFGTRKSRDHFAKLTGDNTAAVFLGNSQYGSACNDEALNIIQKATYKKCTEDDTEIICINDYRIWQMRDGLVTVSRLSFPFKIRTSPKNCSLTLSTPTIHCTASSRDAPHLFVRHQDQSMHFDGGNFVVRYKGNSAGFDKNDYLTVY